MERPFTGPRPKTRLPAGTIDTHTHMYLKGFEAQPGGVPLPEGEVEPTQYRQVMDWLGIDRVVVAQGNAHQSNHDNLVACLKEMGTIARGVAAISPNISEAELSLLHEAGVRGTRIMDLPGGAVSLTDLHAVDQLTAEMNWMIAVQFDGTHIADHAQRLAAVKSDYVIDHHGKFFAGISPDGPEVAEVKRLIDRGNCWFKFAGCYESSKSGGPEFSDIAEFSQQIARHAPERIIWGTNWPHNMAKTAEDYPDDGALLDTVLGWFENENALQLVLVENPARLFDFS